MMLLTFQLHIGSAVNVNAHRVYIEYIPYAGRLIGTVLKSVR